MPYIKKEDRIKYESIIQMFSGLAKHHTLFNYKRLPIGDFNYLITSLCLSYLNSDAPIKYEDYNSIIGVLECAKLELYRRQVAKYEDTKIKENSDIFK
jgi:hypothetical protein